MWSFAFSESALLKGKGLLSCEIRRILVSTLIVKHAECATWKVWAEDGVHRQVGFTFTNRGAYLRGTITSSPWPSTPRGTFDFFFIDARREKHQNEHDMRLVIIVKTMSVHESVMGLQVLFASIIFSMVVIRVLYSVSKVITDYFIY